MRKSLEDLPKSMVRKVDDYPGLPAELKELCYWLPDSGYNIMAIPESVLKEHFGDMDLWRHECPMPVKYVLEKGYKWFEGYLVVDAPYSHDFGLIVDDKYTEF